MAELKKSSSVATTEEKPDATNTQTEEKKEVRQDHASRTTETSGAEPHEDATMLLAADHRTVEKLFEQYRRANRRAEKLKVARQICHDLVVHTMLEEEIFYPACREHIDDEMLDEAQVEHDSAKILLNEILSGSPDQAFYDAKVEVLSEIIKHHVNEEEKTNEGMFAKAKAAGLDGGETARRLKARKNELVTLFAEKGLERPRTRSFVEVAETERHMPREYYRDRDERDRFEDDNGNRRYASRSARYEDDRRSYGRGRERDETGRFASDDDDRHRYSRGQERERDERGRFTSEDDDRRSGRSHGGWFGDPQGHSEASRRGWDERHSHEDDDDRHRYSRGQERERDERGRFTSEDDDRHSSGRSHGGWFGDPQGHSEASRRGWDERYSHEDDDRRRYSRAQERERDERGRFTSEDDDRRSGDRSHGGWFGDPEGHSEASRRGWEERGHTRASARDDDDDRRYRSGSGRGGTRYGEDEGHYGRGQERSRDERGRFMSDEDDGRRSGSSRHGGWFGDPEGHSEASRRGWDERYSGGGNRQSSRSGR
jgi:hemerythrin superfamily protein